MNTSEILSFILEHKDYIVPPVVLFMWLVSGFLAGIFSRISAKKIDIIKDGDAREAFLFLCPICGPLGLLFSLAVYLFWYLPAKILKE